MAPLRAVRYPLVLLACALSAALALAACSAPTTLPATASAGVTVPPTGGPPPAAPAATAGAAATPFPALTARPLVWFAPLPPLPVHEGRPFTGSLDFMHLFEPQAPWQAAAARVQVFKLYGEWVAYQATDAELRLAVQDLNRRGIALAVEAGPLNATAACGQGVEGFAGSAEGLRIAGRILAAGGYVRLLAMDEPFFFASLYDGPNACRWPADKIAREVAGFVDVMRGAFPEIVVGDTEPLAGGATVEQYQSWLRTYRDVTGEELPFFHLDVDFSRPDWPAQARALETFARARGTAFGIIYFGDWHARSDYEWLAQAGEHVKAYELAAGGQPDHVLFQSWHDHPDYSLPEGSADTFTAFINAYFTDRAGLGFRTQGPGANLAFGKPVRVSRSLPGFEPARAVDGDPGTWWGAGDFAPQWIEVDLGAPATVASVRLVPSQSPAGRTLHRLLVKGSGTGDRYVLAHTFDGASADFDDLLYTPPAPWEGVRYVRVETTLSPSWIAWREIEVLAGPQR